MNNRIDFIDQLGRIAKNRRQMGGADVAAEALVLEEFLDCRRRIVSSGESNPARYGASIPSRIEVRRKLLFALSSMESDPRISAAAEELKAEINAEINVIEDMAEPLAASPDKPIKQ